MKTLLQQSTTYPGTNPARTFASFFRQWVQICSVASPVQGTYFLQVQTGKKIDGTAAPNGGGSNRFSIRVGLGTNFATTNGLHVYGNQKMGAYANATGANTQFYPDPGAAGRGGQDAGAQLLRHRRRVASAGPSRCSRPPTPT